MDYAFRLEYGSDLKRSIEQFCIDKQLHSCCIVCCVGCVYQAKLRLADGKTIKQFDDHYEIVSLTGTICYDVSHIHISLSDVDGKTIGGHLCYGTLINTTAEIVIRCLDDKYLFTREFDNKTGYDELVIKGKRSYIF